MLAEALALYKELPSEGRQRAEGATERSGPFQGWEVGAQG